MTLRNAALAVTVAGLTLAACSNDADTATTSTTSSASAPASSGTSSAASSTSAAAPSGSDMDACVQASSAALRIREVQFAAMSGSVDQSAVDTAFPAGTVDKIPAGLQPLYTDLETQAKALVGLSRDKMETAADTFGTAMSKYSTEMQATCAP